MFGGESEADTCVLSASATAAMPHSHTRHHGARGGEGVRTTRMLITNYHNITQSNTVYVRLLKAYGFEGKGMSKTV